MRDIGDGHRLDAEDIAALVRDTCQRAGFSASVADSVARSIVMAERGGARRLGLGLLPQMIEHARSGQVDPKAVPTHRAIAPAVLRVDAAGGFTCPALDEMLDDLAALAAHHGLACAEVVNAYPIGSLAALHEATTRRALSLIAHVQGLVPRPTPAGRIELRIEAVTHGLPVTPGLLARTREAHTPDRATPDFEGPVGPAFRLTHRIVLLRNDVWPDDPGPPPEPSDAVEDSGIVVQVDLLEKIITA